MTSRIGVERDNIRSGLANAIEEGDVAQAVQIVANHPHRDRANAGRIGQVLRCPPCESLDLPGAATHPEYPRVMMVAAYEALDSGDTDRADALCHQALEAADGLPTPLEGPPLEIDALTLRAETSLAAGAYADAVPAYTRAAEPPPTATRDCRHFLRLQREQRPTGWRRSKGSDRQSASASINWPDRSGVPGAIVIALNSLALTLVDSDPERARYPSPGEHRTQQHARPGNRTGVRHRSVGCRAAPGLEPGPRAGRPGDAHVPGIMNPLHSAPCLAECARALAEDRPEVAGVLTGSRVCRLPARRATSRHRESDGRAAGRYSRQFHLPGAARNARTRRGGSRR